MLPRRSVFLSRQAPGSRRRARCCPSHSIRRWTRPDHRRGGPHAAGRPVAPVAACSAVGLLLRLHRQIVDLVAATVAHLALGAERLQQPGADLLPGHLHQPETGHLGDLVPGPVAAQALHQPAHPPTPAAPPAHRAADPRTAPDRQGDCAPHGQCPPASSAAARLAPSTPSACHPACAPESRLHRVWSPPPGRRAHRARFVQPMPPAAPPVRSPAGPWPRSPPSPCPGRRARPG